MSELNFIRDGWLESSIENDDERRLLTRLKIVAGKAVLTHAFSKRGGGETEALNVTLLPLAEYIAKMWWPLLYEPLRAHHDRRFIARHRLDLPMHGYVFPALALCSAGNESVLVDWARLDNEHSPFEFLTAAPKEPLQISRETIEPTLMDIVESALDRLSSGSRAHVQLRENWERVRESFEHKAQANYCMAAGRLGIDPYDPQSPDFSEFAEHLPEDLFSDLSEVVDISKIADITLWTRNMKEALVNCPSIDLDSFGPPPEDDLRMTAGEVGFHAASTLRARLGFDIKKPQKTISEFLGSASNRNSALAAEGPAPLTGLIHRINGHAKIGTLARSARQQRFRACAAAYIGWCTDPGEIRAGTAAFTRRQQSSRAFAAEMVAPREYLFERSIGREFTEEDIEQEAGKLIAPYETVLWQAWRGGAALWNVELPMQRRSSFF